MHKDRILELADFLETCIEDEAFDMSTWVGDEGADLTKQVQGLREDPRCGTAACIAGWAVVYFGHPQRDVVNVQSTAQEILGLTGEEATALFLGLNWFTKPGEDAIDILAESSRFEAADELRALVGGRGSEEEDPGAQGAGQEEVPGNAWASHR